MQKTRGFTLIELLVVIAIIGILASIVLVSLGETRTRAQDAKIISSMGQLRTVGEYFRGDNNTYTGLCDDADVTTLVSDITNQGGANYNCQTVADSYCIEVQLNSDNWWCVDSALRSQQYTSAPVCDAGQGTKSCE